MASSNTLGRMTDMLFEELERLNAVDVTDGGALAAERERRRVEGHPWSCDRARYARGADRAEDE